MSCCGSRQFWVSGLLKRTSRGGLGANRELFCPPVVPRRLMVGRRSPFSERSDWLPTSLSAYRDVGMWSS
jgi:hypothetical protein